MGNQFKISSALKSIIGRELITSDFVAIFELVKNSFDAHARRVDIEFAPDRIMISDDGKGMSASDITSKWLFVAYSAKKTGDEDATLPRDYRDEISQRRGYAGNKGIGRFSCDRLGSALDLYSRPIGGSRVQHLHVDWSRFEQDAMREFATVDVDLGTVSTFPQLEKAPPPAAEGTMLVIGDLRDDWTFHKIDRLRSYLAKLVDPFQATADLRIVTHVAGRRWPDVEGPVGNDIIDLLDEKTARIAVRIEGRTIRTTLHDRGVLIYDVEEGSTFPDLKDCIVDASLYYLNRSAKRTFTSRMGVQPVQFGNIFLFVNGFRIFPVGEPTDDTFGVGRRKQQGSARYLGLRDVIGKIAVSAPAGMFVEASSRDAGIIQTPARDQLYEAVMRHVFIRLERYAVTVNWVDKLDQDRDDASGLRSDAARARIINIVQALAGSKRVKLLGYDRELVDIVNERTAGFEAAMEGLALVAQETGDQTLLARVERSRQRFEDMRQAQAEAEKRADQEALARQGAEKRAQAAEMRAEHATVRLELVEKQAKVLLNSQAQGSEQLQLLHHQVIIYAVETQALARRSIRRLGEQSVRVEDVAADLERIMFQNSRILAVTRLATQANFKLEADRLDADLLQYMEEYAEKVATLYGDVGQASFNRNDVVLERSFQPIDVAIVIDNLFSNAAKAGARKITFDCSTAAKGTIVEIYVADDGRGIDERRVDTEKLFERGYSGSPRGSGLGLYHARQVIEGMGGSLELDPQRKAGSARFIIRMPKEVRGK